MSAPKFAPWTAVHLNILLYLAWQKNGHYKNIEQAWAEQAPDSKRTLRAIEEKLRSISKDINAVGLQKYFQSGAPARRKSKKSAEGSLVVKASNVTQPTIRKELALPAPKQNTAISGTEKSAIIDVDELAIAVDRYEEGPHAPATQSDISKVSGVVPSGPRIKTDPSPSPQGMPQLQDSSKRKALSSLLNDNKEEAEDSDSMLGPTKKRKGNEDSIRRPARRSFDTQGSKRKNSAM